jgi:hypothetical protein
VTAFFKSRVTRLGDCLLWVVFEKTFISSPNLEFLILQKNYELIMTKMGWATFWATFSQNHLVALFHFHFRFKGQKADWKICQDGPNLEARTESRVTWLAEFFIFLIKFSIYTSSPMDSPKFDKTWFGPHFGRFAGHKDIFHNAPVHPDKQNAEIFNFFFLSWRSISSWKLLHFW